MKILLSDYEISNTFLSNVLLSFLDLVLCFALPLVLSARFSRGKSKYKKKFFADRKIDIYEYK